MSEIRWAEMSPEQRDELVHEKVMGRPLTCNEPIVAREVGLARKFYLLNCPVCGHLGHSDEVPATNVHRNNEEAPAYTTSIDAAWQLVERFGSAELKKWPNVRRYEDKPYSCSIATRGKTFSEWSATPQEAICLAALKAVGWDEPAAEQSARDHLHVALPDGSVANSEPGAK